MARKTTSKPTQPDAAGVIERMEFSLSIPPEPAEPRPGVAVSLAMVNVFGEPVADGARLRLTAWVNNLSYVKDVWVDAYLVDAKGAVVLSETMVLDYYEGAGGGGDFFILDTAIPGAKPPAALLAYRLYYNIGDTVYTDGIPHTHGLTHPTAKAAATPASKAVKAAATIATAGAAAAAAAVAAKLASRTQGKAPAKEPARSPAKGTKGTPEPGDAPAAKATAAARTVAKKTVAKVAPAKVAPAKEATEGDGQAGSMPPEKRASRRSAT
ncbi:MAG: hypothetical protein ACRDJO_00180 [Actinomycetota bacterium]